MLNGVGGRTIAEAKERMTYQEALAWGRYIDRYGSLHTGRRLEASSAMVALQTHRLGGGLAEMLDFMPHEQRQGLSLERAIQEWQ
ncbi:MULTISPECIES: hypothetical protein [Pseudomonas]|uniref:hypothetical protein n=1 Tax=Pseudomonas TaxID=286 RepID=UPI00087CF33F|nr:MULTISPECIES: hypothetical protein [Pseudomonas]MCI9875269.1 hypothetical protein [Pseudomonas atacamensis]SDT46424.1 hypothetical protein SAMN05216496_4728 [Pseudomonas sp. Z003-0.4C(8344-21)]